MSLISKEVDTLSENDAKKLDQCFVFRRELRLLQMAIVPVLGSPLLIQLQHMDYHFRHLLGRVAIGIDHADETLHQFQRRSCERVKEVNSIAELNRRMIVLLLEVLDH
jgi:hypothetical protein